MATNVGIRGSGPLANVSFCGTEDYNADVGCLVQSNIRGENLLVQLLEVGVSNKKDHFQTAWRSNSDSKGRDYTAMILIDARNLLAIGHEKDTT